MKAHKDELKELSRFPKSWRHATEGTFPRLALENLPISRQEELGWYEVQGVVPTFDPTTHRLVRGSLLFTGTSITRTDTAEVTPQVELDAQITASADAQLRQIDLDSIAGIREWISAQPNPPANIAALEGLAVAERAKRRP